MTAPTATLCLALERYNTTLQALLVRVSSARDEGRMTPEQEWIVCATVDAGLAIIHSAEQCDYVVDERAALRMLNNITAELRRVVE